VKCMRMPDSRFRRHSPWGVVRFETSIGLAPPRGSAHLGGVTERQKRHSAAKLLAHVVKRIAVGVVTEEEKSKGQALGGHEISRPESALIALVKIYV